MKETFHYILLTLDFNLAVDHQIHDKLNEIWNAAWLARTFVIVALITDGTEPGTYIYVKETNTEEQTIFEFDVADAIIFFLKNSKNLDSTKTYYVYLYYSYDLNFVEFEKKYGPLPKYFLGLEGFQKYFEASERMGYPGGALHIGSTTTTVSENKNILREEFRGFD